jgi:hypothetical protein
MIVFDLACQLGHKFEGWFSSADDFAGQKKHGILTCPRCGTGQVERVPSATRINVLQGEAEKAPAEVPVNAAPPRDPIALAQILYSKMVDELLTSTEDVGSEFPAEARRIHNEEAPARAIRGVATQEEHDALEEEGIPVMRLPIPPGGRLN